MRLGADGLLAEDGLHRLAISGGVTPPPPAMSVGPNPVAASTFADAAEIGGAEAEEPPPHRNLLPAPLSHEHEHNSGEPVLTADELRALLHEQSPMPPEE